MFKPQTKNKQRIGELTKENLELKAELDEFKKVRPTYTHTFPGSEMVADVVKKAWDADQKYWDKRLKR